MRENQNGNIKMIHPEYKIVGYDGTSRVYSNNPSLSQVPKILRHSVIPHSGNKFLYADIKSAEFYILCKWSKCKSLVDVYEAGGDLYAFIAQTVLNKTDIDSEERETIKCVVLSILYGSEGSSVARTLRIPEEEAKALVYKLLSSFPEISSFQSKAYAYTLSHGYTQSFYFRPRILKEDIKNSDVLRKRQSINSAIQNTCADCLKVCIGNLVKESKVIFVTSVFDSVLFEVPSSFTDIEARDFLVNFFSYCKPFKFRFDYAMGNSWGEAYENLK